MITLQIRLLDIAIVLKQAGTLKVRESHFSSVKNTILWGRRDQVYRVLGWGRTRFSLLLTGVSYLDMLLTC
jgi:hypothetical protein